MFNRRRFLARASALCLICVALAAPSFSKQTPWDGHIGAGKDALHAGNYPEARTQLDAALADTRLFQMKDPRLGVTYFCLGELSLNEQSYADAKQYYQRALELQQQTPGTDELAIADTLYGLATAAEMTGDRDLAVILLKRVKEIWSKHYGTNSKQIGQILKPMGIYATMGGDYPAAEQCYRQLVSYAEQTEGSNSPAAGCANNLLAMILTRTGKYSDSAPYAERAVQILAQAPEYRSLYEQAADNLAFIDHELGKAEPHLDLNNSSAPAPAAETVKVIAARPPTATAPTAVSKISTQSVMRVPATSVRTGGDDFRPWQTNELASSAAATAAAGSANVTADDGSRKRANWGTISYLANGRLITEQEYEAMLLANEAYELIRQEKYKMACDVLHRALGVCPDLASAHTNLGLALSQMGNTQEAIQQLQQAIALDPKKSAPWVNLASAFQINGDLKSSVATYKEFVKRFPSHPLAAKANELVAHLQNEVDEQTAVASTLGGSSLRSLTDYLAFASHPAEVRWPNTASVLHVYVGKGDDAVGYKPEYDGFCKQAFSDWASASGGKVAFDFVRSPQNADIDWKWTNDLSRVPSLAEGGDANVTSSGKTIKHATVTVLTANASADSPLSPNQIRAVCLHEIGHALGLVGHSPIAQDIMYCSMPAASIKPQLSSRDVGTIKRLYTQDMAYRSASLVNHG